MATAQLCRLNALALLASVFKLMTQALTPFLRHFLRLTPQQVISLSMERLRP